MLGLIAMVLGFVANLRIVRSGGRLRGRGYALWGLGLGTATTFIWLSLWDIAGTRVLEPGGVRVKLGEDTQMLVDEARAVINEVQGGQMSVHNTMKINDGDVRLKPHLHLFPNWRDFTP